MKLIVLNLPRDFDEQELEELFKEHGNVSACNLVLDGETGTSKGFGFVEMALEHDPTRLYLDEIGIEKLHGSKVKKRKIRVKPAK